MAEDEKKEAERKEKREEEAPEAKKPAAGPSKVVRWLVGAAVFLLIILVGGAVAYYVARIVIEGQKGPSVVDVEGQREIDPEKPVEIFEFESPFRVILTDPEGRGERATLLVTVRLQVNPDAREPDAAKIKAELAKRKWILRNAIYDVLYAQDPRRFIGANAAQGWGDLKAQIQKAVHDQMPSGYQVQAVLFDDPIFQGG